MPKSSRVQQKCEDVKKQLHILGSLGIERTASWQTASNTAYKRRIHPDKENLSFESSVWPWHAAAKLRPRWGQQGDASNTRCVPGPTLQQRSLRWEGGSHHVGAWSLPQRVSWRHSRPRSPGYSCPKLALVQRGRGQWLGPPVLDRCECCKEECLHLGMGACQ